MVTNTKNIPLKKEEESKKFKLIISKDLEKKIRRLCEKYPTKEWSGPLFFREKEGSIMDVSSLVIECLDVFPADLGSSTYTEYDNMERITSNTYSHQEYMDDKDLLEATIGHIHSHNSMPSFFSVTDETELTSHAKNHDYYLSLIVNNSLQCVAKICEIVEIVTIKKTTGRGGVITTEEKRTNGVIQYDSEIEFEESRPIGDVLFEKALTALEEHEKNKVKTLPINYGKAQYYNPATRNYQNYQPHTPPKTYSQSFDLPKKPTVGSEGSIKNEIFDDTEETDFPKFYTNSEDLTIAILSGWAMDSEFNYNDPILIGVDEIVGLMEKDPSVISELGLTLRSYITKYLDQILAICKDYSIPASNIDGILKQMENSVETELAPWNMDFYTPNQVGIINAIIKSIKSI
jgi:hypothetical protein